MASDSPFSISAWDLEELGQSDGFRIVRQYLSDEPTNSFCSQHQSLSVSIQCNYLDHCTIIHSILLPLLQIRQQASRRARAILQEHLGRNGPIDLELAFKGAARGAFSWLQCFIKEEWEWCVTTGCPACNVNQALQAEPFIRILVAGCRLSEYLQDLLGQHDRPQSSKARYQSKSDDHGNHGPLLPPFSFFLDSMHMAIREDAFWGLHFWDDIEVRALDLEEGIKDLIAQCCEICNPLPPARSPSSSTASSTAGSPRTRPHDDIFRAPQPYSLVKPSSRKQPVNKVKNSRLAKCQIKLQREEQEWMNKIIEACWRSLVTDAAQQRRNGRRSDIHVARPTDGFVRSRSLTA